MKRLFRKKNNFSLAFIASVLLHLILLFFYGPVKEILIITPDEVLAANPEDEEKRIEFELVETPADAPTDQIPDKTNLLSDKNSIARDEYTGQDKAEGNPYSQGQTEYKIFAGAQVPPSQPELPVPNPDTDLKDEKSAKESVDEELEALLRSEPTTFAKQFSRSVLLGGTQVNPSPIIPQSSDDATYRNLEFSSKDLGGVTLNTYAWEFAPYILEMKRKLRQNIYPPPAFMRLGLIQGETILRFKVMPNGEMQDLETLGHNGHPSLKETSLNAVKNSSPFKTLPGGFPEKYLELTWKFIYSTIHE